MTFSERWLRQLTRGLLVQYSSQQGERTQRLRAPQLTPPLRSSRSHQAQRLTRHGPLYPAEYRLPTPNSCAELDETRRPSSDPPFTTTPQRGSRETRNTTGVNVHCLRINTELFKRIYHYGDGDKTICEMRIALS